MEKKLFPFSQKKLYIFVWKNKNEKIFWYELNSFSLIKQHIEVRKDDGKLGKNQFSRLFKCCDMNIFPRSFCWFWRLK
jgi:hypothetical protein